MNMKMIIRQVSKRKLTRFSFAMMCILCGYGVYHVYLFHFQRKDLTHSFSNAEKLQIYSAFFVQNENGDSHQQKRPELSKLPEKYSNYDEKKLHLFTTSKDGAQNGPLGEFVTARAPLKAVQSPQIQAYMDADLSDNFMDIHDMNNINNVNSLDGVVSHTAEMKENQRNFHYPDVGYRYNSAVNEPHVIPASKIQSAQNNFTSTESLKIRSVSLSGSNISNTNLSKYKVANNNTVKSNVSTVKKAAKQNKLFSNAMPPPIDKLANKGPEDIRYLVYLCDSLSLCGGWGDRQRGMVSTYLLSRVVDRQLKIIMTTPCSLGLFYTPNRVQWQPQGNELFTNSSISINAITDKTFQFNIMSGDFNSKFPQKVIYLKTSQDYFDRLKKNTIYSSLLNQWGGLNLRHPRFHWAWSDLMQPSKMILTHLQYILGTHFLTRKGLISSSASTTKRTNSTTAIGNSTLICAHVRMGKNPTIPMDESLKSFKLEYLTTLFNFMLSKDTQGNAKFFVATDYEYVRSESKRFFGARVVNYGGKILHIDRQRGEESACLGFEVALIDQLILSLCDILVICKSGFSMNASFMSNSTGHVYYLKDGVIDLFKGKSL